MPATTIRAELIDAVVASLEAGRGVALVGPAGIGKSMVADDVVARLEPTHAVIRARGRRAAHDVAMGAYEAVLPPGIDQIRAATTHLRDQVQGAGRPGLLVVDDAANLDDASAFITQALASTDGIVALLSHRRDAVLPPAVDQLWGDGTVAEVVVEPLRDHEVATLAAELLGGPLGPSTLTRLCRLAEGNPLFVVEVLAGGQRSGALTAQGGTWHWEGPWRSGVRLVGLVEEHLGALSEPERDLIDLLAIAEPIDPSELFATTDHLGPAEAEALDRLGLVQLDRAGRLVLRHPLYGEVLRARLPSLKRRRFASILARLPEPDRVDRRIRSINWRIEAGLDVAADELLEAANLAMSSHDHLAVVELARRAVEAGAEVRGSHFLGVALDELGETTEAVAAIERGWAAVRRGAVAADGSDDEAVVLLGLARADLAITHGEDPAVAFAYLDELEEVVPAARDRIDADRVLLLQLVGRPLDALAMGLADGPPPDADLPAIGLPLILSLTVVGRTTEAIELATRALTAREVIGDTTGVARMAVFAVAMAEALEAAGRFADAEALASMGHQRSAEEGATLGEAWFGMILGNVALIRGDARQGESWHAEAAAAFSACTRPPARWASSGAALAAVLAGDAARARAHVTAIDDAPPTGWRFLDPLVDRARGWLAWADGQPATAAEHLAAGVARADAGGMAWLASVLATDLVRFGHLARGGDRLGALAGVVDDPRPGAWARATAALVEADLDAALVEVDALEALGATLEASDLLALVARAAWPLDVHRATDLARRARAATPEPICSPARQAMADTPGLSARVVEVGRLAATGASSRQIADRLIIGVRTVDNHLGRIFRTLGLEGRHELGPALDAWWGPADRPGSAQQ